MSNFSSCRVSMNESSVKRMIKKQPRLRRWNAIVVLTIAAFGSTNALRTEDYLRRHRRIRDGRIRKASNNFVALNVNGIDPTNNVPSSKPSKFSSDRPSPSPTITSSFEPSTKPSGYPSMQPSQNPSTSPSVAHSNTPSKYHSNAPSKYHSTQPSSNPSMIPTFIPSYEPSEAPSDAPSLRPSTLPTKEPSERPSLQPTAEPSSEPTPVPSSEPTPVPSSEPTPVPSSEPTPVPSKLPTSQPIASPSAEPTFQPSSLPSILPSSTPTSKPSMNPSNVPTLTPSAHPTLSPSSSPSISVEPSDQPSSRPSAKPTSLPSTTPTQHPTSAPSDVPSHVPSFSPTLPTQSFTFKQDVSFDDCDELDTKAISIIEDVTGEMIYDQLKSNRPDAFEDLQVRPEFVHQTAAIFGDFNSTENSSKLIPDDAPLALGTGGAGSNSDEQVNGSNRMLSEGNGLLIIFDLFITLKSTTTFDIASLQSDITQTFDTMEEKFAYIHSLQKKANEQGNNSYERINRAEVQIDGQRILEVPLETDPTVETFNWELWGTVIGSGAFVVILAGVFALRRRRPRLSDNQMPSYFGNPDFNETESENDILPIIDIDNNTQDISTLGEPTLPGVMNVYQPFVNEETNSGSGGYDFQRAYRGGDGEDSESSDVRVKSAKTPDSIVSSKESEEDNSNRSLLSNSSERSSLKMENVSLFTDDDSFERMYAGKYEEEERVEVIAPAGKLGVVIDTPLSGVPMVHAIKDSSVLSDQVKIGDKLISVDNQDTCQMSAIKVSKLISSKANNSKRVLVFLRPPSHA